MTQPFCLKIINAELAYHNTMIFSGINLTLTAGQWTALLGPSGIGKSSLLRMIAGLTTTETISGQLHINNDKPLQQQIAYMAQTDLLLPWLKVLDNTLLGFKLRGKKNDYTKQIIRAKSLLENVGLGAAMHLYPHQLSGGMRQRVALVRTLLEDKPLVLMDEPFSAVDTITRYKLQELAATLLKDKTVLFVTHDPMEALRLANTIYVMENKPARLKLVAHLDSSIPRALTNTEIMKQQAVLYHELTKASDDLI